jgi:hypothetical protein
MAKLLQILQTPLVELIEKSQRSPNVWPSIGIFFAIE